MKKTLILISIAIAATSCVRAQSAEDGGSNAYSVNIPGGAITHADFINAAESTVNGVVSVKSYATPRTPSYDDYDDSFSDPFFDFFFGHGQRRQAPRQREAPKQQQVGLGSGVIISTDGLIVTNNHVIDGAERLEVTLNDNRNYTATIIGNDPTTDLALIQINAPDLHVIPMGNSEDLHVGEWVLAVGNPFGFTSTVTSGIVSAKARNISSSTNNPSSGGIEAYIQTDAAVNRGNSGGALVNLKGELVGINTAIYSQTGTYAGCSFAIPTSIVQKVINDLKEYGTVQRAFLGISFIELTPELVAEKGIKGANRGVYVAEVQDRSAAKDAGLANGDVVTHINGAEVTNSARLQEIMVGCSPGDKITIDYVRDGKREKVDVTLRNRDGKTSFTRSDSMQEVLGATLSNVSGELLKKLEISRGVEVKITGSGRFSNVGISDGFIITSINNVKVGSPADVEKIYNSVKSLGPGEDRVLFISGIYPTGRTAYYAVPLSD